MMNDQWQATNNTDKKLRCDFGDGTLRRRDTFGDGSKSSSTATAYAITQPSFMHHMNISTRHTAMMLDGWLPAVKVGFRARAPRPVGELNGGRSDDDDGATLIAAVNAI